MSMPSDWDDAQIHAYVDGALDADAAARLELDGRGDTALAARIARQRELRASLRASFDPVLDEPIPQRLLDALAGPEQGAVVMPIGAARKDRSAAGRRTWSLREWSAMAATLVLGALLGQFVFRQDGSPIEPAQSGWVAAAYLDAALSTQLSGAADAEAAARIGMTFQAAAGEYCRTFALRGGAGGLACRREGRWSVELLDGRGAQPAGDDGFRQAASAVSPAMLGAITALGAGDPLTTDEERQRVGQGWDAPGR
jgi:anti-sigma factor RsiW